MTQKRTLGDSDDDGNFAPLAVPSGEPLDAHNKADHQPQRHEPPAQKKRDTAADKGEAHAPPSGPSAAGPAAAPAGRHSPEPRLSTEADTDPPQGLPGASSLAPLPCGSRDRLEPPPLPPISAVDAVLFNAMDPAAYQQDWTARSELSSSSSGAQSAGPAAAAAAAAAADVEGLPGSHQDPPFTATASTEDCNEYTLYLPGTNPQPVTKALRQTIANELQEQGLRAENGAPDKVHGFSIANEVHYAVNDTFVFTPAGLECHAEPARPYKNPQRAAELFPVAPLNYPNARRPGFARNCAINKEKGAAKMLATLFQSLRTDTSLETLLYDEETDTFYIFAGHWRLVRPAYVGQLISTVVPAEYVHARDLVKREHHELGDDKRFAARRESLEQDIKALNRAIGSLSVHTASVAVMRIAKGELSISRHCNKGPGSPTPQTFWDPASHYIGTANGVLVSLQDGLPRQAVPGDRVRTTIQVEWKGLGERASLWRKLNRDVFGNDPDTTDAFQEHMGYALTGNNIHSVAPILYGEGSNGKSCLKECFVNGMGSFVKPISHSVMVQSRKAVGTNTGHTSDLADLEGVRIGFVSETQKTDELREDRVKMITGGDTVSVRRAHCPAGRNVSMRLVPILISNHLPSCSATFSMKRRLRFFEFSNEFVDNPNPEIATEHLKDPFLQKKICDQEKSGILACLVEGSIRCHRRGSLPESANMKRWADEYWACQPKDPIATFVEQCELGDAFQTPARSLYQAYVNWCNSAGEPAVKERAFGMAVSKTIPKTRVGPGVCYKCRVRPVGLLRIPLDPDLEE